ncbi:MBL fold metallo-hydrolase [Pyxidicoccus parkwayensis]|uniref:MBL fold metallo-hydrolase n=1 Tax=Pyxidicoccus parkwayensis TaxID=2813578 RepID=A0ABX7P0X0_9BACT|nr:MBL fold metallo-hydrolase [Pyxidicoccus parkwaysis]QSQ24418.1 MBL fold metallo-hydrolase [Pyxidicoccus parkwaysis]
MRRIALLGLLLLALPASATDDARARVQAAAEAMGGEARLRALSSLRIQGIGHWNLLEQSERPTPPWLVMYEQVDELRVPSRQRLRQKTEGRGAAGAGAWQVATLVMDGDAVAMEHEGKLRPVGGAQLQDMRERLDFAPERILLTALDAKDLHGAPDTALQDVPHHVVTFHQGRAAVRLFLNANTGLPTLVESEDAHPADMFWSVWGDVRTRLFFQSWSLEAGGLRYPRNWEWQRNDTTYHSFTVTALELEPKVSDADFAIPDDVRKAFAARGGLTVEDLPLGRPDRPAVELAPGVVHIPGRWDVALVKQEDGLVVIEAPIASGYSARVLEEAAKRFPGVKVKAVVSTSDAWPHVGGVREYASRGIPLHVLDLNRPLVERLLKAPRSRVPDALAKAPRAAKLQVVARRTVLGTGANRLELIPVRTETGERMLFVWMPEHHILYSSDLVQPGQSGGFFNPQQLSETVDVAAREKLDVARVFGMHLGATEWKALTDAVEKARAPTTASATP